MSMRQKDMDVATYTEEFQKVVKKPKLVEPESVNLPRYMQGLRVTIQDELSLKNSTIVNQCFQLELEVKEKFKRRNEQDGKNKGMNDKGKIFGGKGPQNNRPKGDSNKGNSQGERSSRGSFRGRRGNGRGRNGG